MCKGTLFLIVFLTTLYLSADAGNIDPQLKKEIDQVSDKLYEDPNGVKIKLLKLLSQNPDADPELRAGAYLTLAADYGMTGNLDSGLWATDKAIGALPDNAYDNMNALKTRAILHRLKGDFNAAEADLKQALGFNDSLFKNLTMEFVILQEYSALCFDRVEYNKATQLLIKAASVFEKVDKKEYGYELNKAKIHISLAEAYARSGNMDLALEEFNQYNMELLRLKDLEGYCRSGLNIAEALIDQGSLGRADSLLNKIIPVAAEFGNTELEAYANLLTGKSKSSARNFTQAIPYYRKAFRSLEKNESRVIVDCANAYLKTLAETKGSEEARSVMASPVLQQYIRQCTNKERLDYLKASIHFRWNSYSLAELQAYYQDLLRLETAVTEEQQLQSSKELQAKYQFEKQELKNQSLERENQFLRKEKIFVQWRLYSLLAIVVLSGIILLLNLHRLRQRSRSQSLRLQSQEQEIEFQKQRTNWAEKEKGLRDQLIQQQKNLLTRALQEAEDTKSQLEQVIRENEVSKRKELLEQFERSKQEKLGLDSLLVQFNSIHPTFTATLIRLYPALSPADIQFCTLFRMNLTTKEISVLMNIEPRSIYQKKYRIMKKMGFGEDDNFERLMFEIE